LYATIWPHELGHSVAAYLFGCKANWWQTNMWLFVGTVFWALANYAEAFSYLVLNTLWLSSDMNMVVLESGVDRWLWLAFGLAAAVFVWKWLLGPLRSAADLLESPRVSRRMWLGIFAGYVGAISVAMGAARIVLLPPDQRQSSRRPATLRLLPLLTRLDQGLNRRVGTRNTAAAAAKTPRTARTIFFLFRMAGRSAGSFARERT